MAIVTDPPKPRVAPAEAPVQECSSTVHNLALTAGATTRLPLTAMASHQCGTIAEIQAADDDTDRLKAMGVCEGRRVEVIKNGDPLILRVLGSRLGISARLARHVIVEACDLPGCKPT